MITVWVLILSFAGQPVVVDNIVTELDCSQAGQAIIKNLAINPASRMTCIPVKKAVAR